MDKLSTPGVQNPVDNPLATDESPDYMPLDDLSGDWEPATRAETWAILGGGALLLATICLLGWIIWS